MKTVVFQIITHLEMGGAERIAFNIAKSKSKEFEYHIVEVARGNSAYTKEMIKELESCNIQYHRSNISSNKKAIILFPFRLKKLYDKYQPSAIHTHTEIPDLSVFIFSKIFPQAKFKLVRTLHNTVLWQDWNKIGSIVEKWIIKNQANVSNSISVTEAYKKNFGPSLNIPLIYNGFKQSSQSQYEGLDYNNNKIHILFAGRFVPQKGIESLIQIVEAVSEDTFDFTIAGTGPLSELLHTKLGNKSNVKIVPPISNLSSYIGSFDYVLITSIHEGLNSLSIEASYNGTPVIVNDIAGLNETIPSDWPLKVQNNNIESYKAIFEKLPNINREQLKNMAFNFVDKNFSISKMQQEYEKFYLKK
jgi:glycosyltransferase involved in cell wall biosynthesis